MDTKAAPVDILAGDLVAAIEAARLGLDRWSPAVAVHGADVAADAYLLQQVCSAAVVCLHHRWLLDTRPEFLNTQQARTDKTVQTAMPHALPPEAASFILPDYQSHAICCVCPSCYQYT